MGTYLATTDIRDKVLADLVVEADIADADTFFLDLVNSRGLEVADISTPVHFRIEEMLIYYVQMRMSEERIGIHANIPIRTNNVTNEDIYLAKYNLYLKKFEELLSGITNSMIEGDADSPEEYTSSTVTFYRG